MSAGRGVSRHTPHPTPRPLTRRAFLLAVAALALAPRRALARVGQPRPHPEPRPGITGARVLPAAALHEPGAAPAFDMARHIPQVLDGIRCHCGCAELEGYRSLLSCFEGDGMAQHCQTCQGQTKLAYRLHRQGGSLDDVRAAIDREFE